LEALEDRTVLSTVWYVNGSATGSDDGHSWANAFTDLQSGLTAAQPGDQIWVAQGTYKPTSTTDRTISFVLMDDVGVYGGFAGTETALGQRNWVAHPTILSGDIGMPGDNSDNSYHVVTAGFSTTPLTSGVIDGFTITGGNANGPGVFGGNGGGLFNNQGALTVSNIIFTGNSATTGGGMDNENNNTSAITNVIFRGNTALYAGGGMYNSNSMPTLTNVLFTGNSAFEFGGGLENDGQPDHTVTLVNVTFSGNTAVGADDASGGAMFCFTGSATLTNCILWGDSAGVSDNEFGQAGGPPSATITISYSDVQGGAAGTGNINADPLFADAATGDFRLRAGSPAIDAGTNTGAPSFDLAGQIRPLDGNGTGIAVTDMGAYEAKASPTFSALLSPSIVVGTATATLSGHLGVGVIHPPAGEAVSVTLNGVTQTAALDGNGDFSTTFDTSMLGAAGSPYAVTYSYGGDSKFNPATGGSTLTIAPLAASIQFTSVTVVPNLLALNQTETINVHVSGPGGVTQGTVTFTVDVHSVSAAVDGNGDATASLTLPLLTGMFPQSISAAFSGPNRSPTNATQSVFWNAVDMLAPAVATFAADGSQSVQSFLLGLPLLDFLYTAQGQLTKVVFGPGLLSWDFRYFGPVAVVSLDGVLPVAMAVSTPQGLFLQAL
jgi:hypothetical protein